MLAQSSKAADHPHQPRCPYHSHFICSGGPKLCSPRPVPGVRPKMQPPLAPCRDNRVSGIQGSRSGIQGSRLSVLLVQGDIYRYRAQMGVHGYKYGFGLAAHEHPARFGTASGLEGSRLETNRIGPGGVHARGEPSQVRRGPGLQRIASSLDPPRPKTVCLEPGSAEAQCGTPGDRTPPGPGRPSSSLEGC